MQIGCLRGCVYGMCVTLAEVNECEVTMTEEYVVMIPAHPWACMKHINLDSLSPTLQITKKINNASPLFRVDERRR